MKRKIISAAAVSALIMTANGTVSAAAAEDPGSMLDIKSIILLENENNMEFDINSDSCIDIFDLMRVKRELLSDEVPDITPEPLPEPETETGRFIYRLYRQILLTEPDETEAAELTRQLDDHVISAADMMLSFMNHPDYTSREISTNDYVTMMYNVILGRDPDEGGYGRWCEKARYFSRQYVMRGFIISAEFTQLCENAGMERGNMSVTESRDQNYEITRSVGQMYSRILGTDLTADELNSMTQDILDKKLTLQIAAFRIAESEQFTGSESDDEEFIDSIFRGLIDREPTDTEKERILGYIQEGATRAELLRRLTVSEDFYELYVSRELRGYMKRIGSNFKLDGVWNHFEPSGKYYPVENQTLLDLLNKSEEIFSKYGDTATNIYNFCINDSRYKFIEATKTEAQLEAIGWTYFADYAFSHYYSVCYYMAAEMDFLLEQSGYRCRVVHATHESGDHYWNQVYINGSWLNYDVTNWWQAYSWDQMVAAGNYRFISYVRPEYK